MGKTRRYLCLPVLKRRTVHRRFLNCRLSLSKYYSWRHLHGVSLSWSPSAGLSESLTDESTCCISAGWRSAQARGSQSPFDSSKSGPGPRVTLWWLLFGVSKGFDTVDLKYRNRHHLAVLPATLQNQLDSTETSCLPGTSWETAFPQRHFLASDGHPWGKNKIREGMAFFGISHALLISKCRLYSGSFISTVFSKMHFFLTRVPLLILLKDKGIM